MGSERSLPGCSRYVHGAGEPANSPGAGEPAKRPHLIMKPYAVSYPYRSADFKPGDSVPSIGISKPAAAAAGLEDEEQIEPPSSPILFRPQKLSLVDRIQGVQGSQHTEYRV